MNLSNVKEITIGNKEVKQLKDTNGNIWWKKSIIEPYTFVSYIESSGTQYIDTNFIPNQDTKVEISISTKTISGSANRSIFGSRAGANSNHYGVTIGGNNCWWNGYGTTNGNTAVSVLSDTFYEIEKNKNVTTINGTQMTPATAETDRTFSQFTSRTACPTVSIDTAVWQMVFNALIPAAFHHFLFMPSPPKNSNCTLLHKHFTKLSDNLQGTRQDAKTAQKRTPATK